MIKRLINNARLYNREKLLRAVRSKAGICTGILVFGIIGSATLFATAPSPVSEQRKARAQPILTLKTSPASVSPDVPLFGRIETPEQAQLTAAIEANVKKVHVREGQSVRAGDLLISLDDSETLLLVLQREADVSDAAAELAILHNSHHAQKIMLEHHKKLTELMQVKLDRSLKLRGENIISASVMDDVRREFSEQAVTFEQQRLVVTNQSGRAQAAEAKLKRTEALLNQALLDLSYTQIKAPFDSAISKLSVFTGDRVSTGQKLLSIFSQTALQVRASIPSQYLAQLHTVFDRGGVIEAVVSVGEKKYPLLLSELATQVSSGKSGVEGLFRIDSWASNIALGQVVNLSMIMPVEPNVIAVPVEAVYDNRRIYVVENNQLRGIDVDKIGETSHNGVYKVLLRSDQIGADTEVAITRLNQPQTGNKVLVLANNIGSLSP